jgi:deoxyribodipyrimidine photo-lyase
VEAWKKGLTGVPYFDACQRQLQQTGVHSDQGRKTAAKFLIQDLGLDFRIGAFHDEEVLLDYDFAVNYGNWSSAATVANAGWTPWYGKQEEDKEHLDLKRMLRVEQEKDPSGAFIRRWVPELRNVDSKHIHTPWLMTEAEMQACGCKLGRRDADAEMLEETSRIDYPLPLLGAFDLSKLNLEEVTADEAA